jgi:hypothetical protein
MDSRVGRTLFGPVRHSLTRVYQALQEPGSEDGAVRAHLPLADLPAARSEHERAAKCGRMAGEARPTRRRCVPT